MEKRQLTKVGPVKSEPKLLLRFMGKILKRLNTLWEFPSFLSCASSLPDVKTPGFLWWVCSCLDPRSFYLSVLTSGFSY